MKKSILAKNLSELGVATQQNNRMPRASTRFSLAGGGGLGFGLNNNNGRASQGQINPLDSNAARTGTPLSHRSANTANELHIENERLKTTLTILTQKLKVVEDDQLHKCEGLQSQINMLEDKNL